MTPTATLDPAIWSDAYERVENLLLAYRVTNRFQLARLSRSILEAAAERHAIDPSQDPADVAALTAQQLIAGWIDELAGPTNESPATRHARGRAAIWLAQLPQLSPERFLNSREVPPALLAQVRDTYLKAGPDLEFSNMAPRPIDLGPISEVADETWKTFARWPLLQGTVLWSLFLATLGVAFYLTRL